MFCRGGDCVILRKGIFAKVLAGGEIKVDDKIEIAE
jgi:MOSC domain-containing protein YiiM